MKVFFDYSIFTLQQYGGISNYIINLVHSHFTLMHKLSLNLANPDIVLSKNYPPIFGRRRVLIIKQANKWRTSAIERVLNIIHDVKVNLRSSSKIKLVTTLERSFLRIASLIKSIN